MKILILANNCRWKTWDSKINSLKKWFSINPEINLEIILEHSSLKNIPWVPYISTDSTQNKLSPLMGIDPKWYDNNVTFKAKGYDIVLLVLPMSEWKYENKARGWRTDKDQGPVELHIGCNEGQNLTDPSGNKEDAFFQLARHEIIHALFMISGQNDTTHKWWDVGNLRAALEEIKIPSPKTTERLNLLTKALDLIIVLFNLKLKADNKVIMETEPKQSKLIDWAEAIRSFEGWYQGSLSQRNHNPGNLRYSPYEIGKNKGFSVFKNDEEGMNALLHQLRLAAEGGSRVYKQTDTILDFFQKYAPSSDGNHPQTYAKFVAEKLGVTTLTQIKELV